MMFIRNKHLIASGVHLSLLKRYVHFVFTLLLAVSFFSCKDAERKKGEEEQGKTLVVKRQPAEFEKQEAVWLIWPSQDHLKTQPNHSVTLEIIKILAGKQKVVVTANTDSLLTSAKKIIPKEYFEKEWVTLHKIPSEELWTRDMGPNFVILEDGRKAIVDFGFNAWGYTDSNAMDEYTIRMEKYDEAVANLRQLPLLQSDLISEGGNREVNGKGVLMLSEVVEMGRNPGMTKSQMESEFKRVLGIEKVIWLKEGLLEDRHTFQGPLKTENGELAYTAVTTNGHIDEFARFVNDSTIVLASVPEEDWEDPIAKENHKRMEENYAILKKATDQKGKPFTIIRMSLPKLILGTMVPGDPVYDYIATLNYEDGTQFPDGTEIKVIAAASYLNFLITDKVVLGQKYFSEGMDEAVQQRDAEVKAILTSVFPNREVILIDALRINFGGGGIHCITMNEPMVR